MGKEKREIVHLILPFNRILAAGHDCSDAFRRLLELIHQIVLKPTPEKKAKLATVSNDVASHVREVIAAAQAIRGVYVHGDGLLRILLAVPCYNCGIKHN